MSGASAARIVRVALLRGADLVASPWKNGGGVTREIAVAPVANDAARAAFAWRVSVADVAQPGPFSRFDGVDRTLVLLEGAGMLLDEAGPAAMTHTLAHPLDIARFAGETAIDARLIDGPTRDFNLMVRRDAARGTLEVWRAPMVRDITAQTVLLYCVQGAFEVRVDRGERVDSLGMGDTLRIDAMQPVNIDTQGAGALLAITLDPIRAHAHEQPLDTALQNAARTS
ncbi:MAG: HutD family protein [Paraburkholderia sp.]|uniref:HutD/Ves family protein n=1 Tax=Paraburkholderia sp. TaxID=1926495 RepID=UPI001229B816|nr:HutD family protein [Paraburkholderia sp.]TAM01174.1 MAG: HutD family protein [Paraburkholderia sp.]